MKKVVIILLLLGIFGCSKNAAPPKEIDPALAKFELLRSGMTRGEVQQIMGVGCAERNITLPDGPFWGPQAVLTRFIPANTPFEEWMYTNATTTFLVWFSSTNQIPREDWRVIGKTSYENNTDF